MGAMALRSPLTGSQFALAVDTATALTVPAGANFALVQAEGKNVRWRDDGTDPTASVGMLLYLGADVLYEGDLSRIKFIGVAAGGTVNVTYYT